MEGEEEAQEKAGQRQGLKLRPTQNLQEVRGQTGLGWRLD